MRNRNYAFQNGQRLKHENMMIVEGVKIPSYKWTCYHAIICALASKKNQFCNWDTIYKLTEKYMIWYGNKEIWENFKNKKSKKDYKQRIRLNAYTLTRSGRHCYGYRLHELGMAIYMFRDGAILFTDGKFIRMDDIYYVIFPSGRTIQIKKQGQSITYANFEKYINAKIMSISGKIFNISNYLKYKRPKDKKFKVNVELKESFNQQTADRFELLKLNVVKFENMVIEGLIESKNLLALSKDEDVKSVRLV